ncbi:GNAT family N-acetyltransferase [Roseomonas sp. WA12]
MREGDLPAVLAIAAVVHPGHPESQAVLTERLALFPAGCLVLEGADGPIGYAIAHPWTRGRAVPLDSLLGTLPATPEAIYLHDVALLPAARGAGAGAEAVRRLAALAQGRPLVLVALGGTEGFWRAQGFVALPEPATGDYGPGALRMERSPGPWISGAPDRAP